MSSQSFNSNSNVSSTMASSAHEQHSMKQRLAAAAVGNPDQDTQMSNPDQAQQPEPVVAAAVESEFRDNRLDDDEDESRIKDHKLTKKNLKSIPDADQLAPGIRLPAERLTGDLNPINGNGNNRHHHHDDHSHQLPSDDVQHEEEVATVPPQLDPRTAEFRPPSPSAASVFSVAVQAPGSPRPETALGDSTSSSSAIFRNNSSSNSRPSSIRGSSPPLSASSEAFSFNNTTNNNRSSSSATGGISAGLNSLNSGFARSSLGGNNAHQGSLTATSTGSQSIGGGPSLAPSEAGSASSDSRSIANSNPRVNGRNSRGSGSINGEDELMNDDDDARVEVGSSNSKNSSSRGEFDVDEDSEEVKLRALYIERQRMHERELMGGEAGVGGLSSLNSKGVLSYPFSAALRQEQEDSRNLNSSGGSASPGGSGFRLPSRAGSTTATVGTSSPPQSLSGVSDYGDNDRARDDKDEIGLSRKGSTDTINSTGGTSFKAPSFVDSNGRRQSRSEVANSPVPMDESS